MAEVKTVVTLDSKEVTNAIIETARGQVKEAIGGATVTWMYPKEGSEISNPVGAVVSFSGKVRVGT